jgi:hypothetical protein
MIRESGIESTSFPPSGGSEMSVKRDLWVFLLVFAISAQNLQAEIPSSGFILLKNGSIIQGALRVTDDEMTVLTQFGSIDFKTRDIDFIGKTLPDVYGHKKSKAVTSYDFMTLAEWCFRNDLRTEGEIEYDRAIQLTESSSLASEMQRRKETLLRQENSVTPLIKELSEEEQKLLDWEKSLPPEIYVPFQEEIQPLLFKRCNGLACHGTHSVTSFQLESLVKSKEKTATLKNLAAVIRRLNPDSPADSPLLVKPIVPHGKAKQIFTVKNLALYETLYYWSMEVVEKWDKIHAGEGIPGGTNHGEGINQTNFTDLSAEMNRAKFPKPGVPLLKNSQKTEEAVPVKHSLAEGFFPEDNSGFGGRTRLFPQENGEIVPQTEDLPVRIVDPIQREGIIEQKGRNPFDPGVFNQQFHPERVTGPTER